MLPANRGLSRRETSARPISLAFISCFLGDFCSVDKIQCSKLVVCLTAFNYHFYFLFSSGTYLEKSPRLGELLNRLVSSGKMLFLITNSGYEFV